MPINDNSCVLEVSTQSGDILKYDLLITRQASDNMNKYHVNIAQDKDPITAKIFCQGSELDSMQIKSPQVILDYTVNGVPFENIFRQYMPILR